MHTAKKLVGVDLYSGCGGLSLGLQKAGIDIQLGVDNWDKAVEVYNLNFTHNAVLHDLSNIKETANILENYEIDVIAGGPPCQDFSSAGKRNINAGRADLTYCYSDVVSEVKPSYFIMENVDQIKKSHILFDVIHQLAAQGYGITTVILNAAHCNVPQARNRFFMIGSLNSPHNFLLGNLEKNLTEKPMTMRDYFKNRLGLEYYYRHPRNYTRRGVYSLDEPSATIRGVNRPVPPKYVKHKNDVNYGNIKNLRALTTSERAEVQTFPANYNWSGSKTTIEQLVGNAVPVNLAQYVGEALIEYHNKGSVELKNKIKIDPTTILIPGRTLDKPVLNWKKYDPVTKKLT